MGATARRRWNVVGLATLTAAGSLAVAPDAAAGRQPVVPGTAAGRSAPDARPVPDSRGWIGIVYAGDEQGRPILQVAGNRRGILIKDVVFGSPALAAGLRRGDLLLSVNGRSLAPDAAPTLHVAPGERIRLEVVRDGRVLLPELVAGRPPSGMGVAQATLRESRVDSLRIRIIQEMDSLLVREGLGESRSIISFFRMEGAGDRVVTVSGSLSTEGDATRGMSWSGSRRPPPAPSAAGRPDAPQRVSGAVTSWGVLPVGTPQGSLPFEVFVLRSGEMEGLTAQLREVRGAMDGLRREENQRRHELATVARTQGFREDQDTTLRSLLEAQEALRIESLRLEREMRSEGRMSIERDAVLAREGTSGRPPSPYVLGQRVVAGAEVTSLNPQLAEYFQGEEGLLVLEVVPASPAAEAGLVPGDIITRMGDRPVRTVDEARSALERSPRGPIPVTLVRRGRSLLVSLPR